VKRRRPTYLELGRRERFGRKPPLQSVGPIVPPPRPDEVAPFDLGTWHIEPLAARMTRGTRVVELDGQALAALLILAAAPAGGVNRDQLILSLFGPGGAETHPEKIRRVLSILRRLFAEDGSVRLVNAPGDCYVLEFGPPREERTALADDAAPLQTVAGATESWRQRRRPRLLAIGLAALVVVALGAVLIGFVDRRGRSPYGTVRSTRVLAGEAGRQLSPSFSQDGHQVVYSWRKPDGSEHLYVRGVGAGSARQLTTGAGKDRYPAWSPVGGLIAFQRVEDGHCAVMVVPPDGGDPRNLAACDFGASGPMTWLPDGNALTFAYRPAWTYPSQIISISVKDGKMIGVTNPVTGMPGDSNPTLASTGRRLAFVRTRAPGAEDATMLEFGGRPPERMTRDSLPLAGLAWEPRGLSLVAASPRAGYTGLWRLRVDGAPPAPLLRRADDLRHPAVSFDGTKLAYERWHVVSRLVAYGPAADTPVSQPWRSGDALDRGAQFSPDHARAVFASSHAGREQLWITGADGQDPAPLTRGDFEYVETPRFSPDGATVVFAAYRQGHFGLWTVEVASGKETAVGPVEDDPRAPSFSRNGHWLYYSAVTKGGRRQLFRRAWPIGAAPEQITQEGGFAAIESTDGELLYFVRPDRRGLWRRSPAPGGDDTLVTPELAPSDWRNWDVSQDAVWFVMRPASDATLARYVFAAGRVVPGPVLPDLLPESGLAISADGRSAIVSEAADVRVDIELATLE
jgi:Tol biopolymer transport system component